MSDREFREISRLSKLDSEDILAASRIIVNRMRSGLVSEEHLRYLEYCASLGDEVCSIIFPNRQDMSARDVLEENDREFSVGFAVWCAEGVLDIFEDKLPDDNRPRLAIDAAKTLDDHPEEENRDAAQTAADAAADAAFAYYAYYTADSVDAAFAVDAAAFAVDAAAFAARAATAAYNATWDDTDYGSLGYARAARYAAAAAARALGNTTGEELLIKYLMRNII